MKKVGIIGSGVVGQALARGFIKYGYEVEVGSRSGEASAALKEAVGDVTTGTFRDVAARAELVVITVRGSAAEGVVGDIADALAGKMVLDVTNPISDDPTENGVLQFFTTLEESLFERLQSAAPDALFVKAFNSVGSAHMVDPSFEQQPTMFYCGDDTVAKEAVRGVIEQFGWEPSDMGGKESARAIEPLCMLWCIPGFLNNEWHHSFKLLTR